MSIHIGLLFACKNIVFKVITTNWALRIQSLGNA